MKNVNFLNASLGDRYEAFSLIHTFSSLYHNENCSAEIIVTDKKQYVGKYKNSLELCKKLGDVYVREPTYSVKNKDWQYHSVRYLTLPKLDSIITFISDIDILILDRDIFEKRMKHIKTLKKPYSATIRYGPDRPDWHPIHKNGYFRGWGAVLTDKWYTDDMKSLIKYYIDENPIPKVWHWDEHIWYTLAEKIHGLPNRYENVQDENAEKENYHSAHGIHLSPGLVKYGSDKLRKYVKPYSTKFQNMINSKEWIEYEKTLPETCKAEINRVKECL